MEIDILHFLVHFLVVSGDTENGTTEGGNKSSSLPKL
jgi:hypothetical protein